MITMLAAIMLAAGGDDASQTRAFAIDAPSGAGLFRIKPSAEASNAWAMSGFQAAAVFDADGHFLPCERVLRNALISQTRRERVIEGHWLSDDEMASLAPIGGFAFDKVWAFDPPPLDEAERNIYLKIDWTDTSTPDAGEVQIVPEHLSRDGSGPLTHMQLSNANPRTSKNPRSHFYIDGMPLAGQLRFRGTLDLEVEHAVLDTATIRPWARTPVDVPGWIIFEGNGRTPYMLQIGFDATTCYGLTPAKTASLADDPDAPPEATVSTERHDIGRLGNPPRQLERQQADRTRRSWMSWGIMVGIGFVVACLLAIARNTSQRRGPDA